MTPYPLSWPENMPRWKGTREGGQFRTPLNAAMSNVQDSLRLFGRDSGKPVSNVIISSNVTLGVNNPSDPGVAIWFIWDGLSVCIPVDRYAKVESNLQAIHHIIEARRVELRHGTLALVRATFTGFAALAAPSANPKRPWIDVLGPIPPRPGWRGVGPAHNREQIEIAYREKAKRLHPDMAGGSNDAMAELNRARTDALRDLA